MDEKGYIKYLNPYVTYLLELNSKDLNNKLFEVIPDYEIDMLFKRTVSEKRNHVISIYFWGKEKRLLEINSFYLPENKEVLFIINDKSIYEKLEENYKDFIANASHELRTPLTSMQILLDLFSERKITLEEIYNEFFPYFRKEIERMSKLVNNLLNLSRLEAGVVELNLQNIFLVDIIEKVLNSLNPLIKKKNLKLNLKISSSLMLHADPQHLETILFNLLENAVKYTPDKGRIEISASEDSEKIILSIKDTGIGISEKDLPYIFDRFYRADRARSSEDGFSSGLGLSIVKKLVEKHGWEISVESKINQGTDFKIFIPKRKEGE
ncbi:MAG: HAMP domain-containing histidine kinase [Dictyoglomus sp.]|nr:HAMP domain-containing histidine kinase [Dictyoglomus sp.]MCX7942348.1 HAMP domain-containing histidine kinase [Dictyoglomaceae bacterium]MDW8188448.1 ATP-binding protein [Dictyoglomus sp.]